jgi:hypothetical protein
MLLFIALGRHGSMDNVELKRHTLPPEQIPPDMSPSKDPFKEDKKKDKVRDELLFGLKFQFS